MAYKISYRAVIATLFILQSVSALPNRSVQNDLKRHNEIIKNAHVAADNALLATHNVANTIAAEANIDAITTRSWIEALQQNFHDTINTLGGDLTSCTEEQQDKISELIQRLEVEVFSCVTDQVNDIAVIVNDVAHLANEGVRLVRESTANISVCLDHPLFAPTCIKEIVEAAEEDVEVIADALERDVAKAESILEAAPGAIKDCASEKLDGAKEETQQIILDIAQCIVDGEESTEDSLEVVHQ